MPLPTNRPQHRQQRTSLKRAARLRDDVQDTEIGDERFDDPVTDEDGQTSASSDQYDADGGGEGAAANESLDFSEGRDDYQENTSEDSGMGERLDAMYVNATGPERGTGQAGSQDVRLPEGQTGRRMNVSAPGEGNPQYPARNHDNGSFGYFTPVQAENQPQEHTVDEPDDGPRREEKHGNRDGKGKRGKGGYDRKRKSKIKRNDAALSESHARTWRWVIIISLFLIVCLGFKNAVFPPPSLSRSDVRQVIYQTTGTTRFPLDRGAAIATGFVDAYIPISDDPAAASMLENYYAGTRFKTQSDGSGSSTSQISPAAGSQISQAIQAGPYVYKEKAVSDNTANYVVGALVYRKQGGQPVMTADGKTPEYRWMYFNVGIVWDEKTDRLAIDPNSPTVTSPPDIRASTSLPPAQLPGDGKLDQDTTDKASDTITNFMKSWAKGDKSYLKTLTAPDGTPSTLNGLDNKLVIKDPSSMKISVYGPPATDHMYRALVELKWSDVVSQTDGQSNSVDYASKYILKLEKTSEGKFLVQDINPYYYVPGR